MEIGKLSPYFPGVSGSGKSSLVRDVLEVKAGEVESVAGLGVTLPFAGQRRYRNPATIPQ